MKQTKFNAAGMAAACAIGVAVSLIATWFSHQSLSARLDEAIDNSPPMVIVDFGALAQKVQQHGQRNLDESMDSVGAAVLKLGDAGFIVLDAQSVLAAPPNMYLPESVIDFQEE